MAANAKFRTQHVAAAPAGYKVRSKKSGSHVLRFAVPPGRRKSGAAKLVEVLHPKKENPSCKIEHQAKTNPSELLIFTNPAKRRNSGIANHKPDCQCVIHKRARGENPRKAKAKKTTPKSSSAGGRRGEKSGSTSNKPRRRRRNPALSETQQAVKLFEVFHGKEAQEVIELHESAVIRNDYAALGALDYLKVRTPIGEVVKFDFEGDGVKLASSPDGKQLYLIGGNQNLVSCLDKDSYEKDFIDLGDALEVQYTARKIHGGFEPTSYYHKFGEQRSGSTLPRLMYDRLRKRIYFSGGEYFIDVNVSISPGIEN